MRFGLRAKSVATVDEVKSKLITSRRIIFTPSTDLKDELSNTSIQITCYDKDGNVLKRVTSADDGVVEDDENENENENENGSNENQNENENENQNPGNGGNDGGDGTDES